MTMKVFLVEDHTMVRQALHTRLERESEIEVVGEASDGRTAIDLIPAYQPDIVIVDVGLPDLSGIEVTRQIHATHPRVKFVALSEHADKRFVDGLFEAGGSAYLLKTNFINELVEALWEVQAGRQYVSSQLTNPIVPDRAHNSSTHNKPSPLTSRERIVLRCVAAGKTTAQIAEELHVSKKTIGTHRQHIMDKLDLHSVAALTAYAIREGLMDGEDEPL
ncbi:MAG: response regulator transcription factor [Gemmatimonadetes bacterium]|nr:response regulator transcription factor [Gemmatimonadota bacterium]